MTTNDELRAIAEAATPGPWHRQTEGNRSIRALAGLVFRMLNRNPLNTDATYVLTFDERCNVCFVGNGPRQTENGDYIATFDPRRALAALNVIEAAGRCADARDISEVDADALRDALARWEALA